MLADVMASLVEAIESVIVGYSSSVSEFVVTWISGWFSMINSDVCMVGTMVDVGETTMKRRVV